MKSIYLFSLGVILFLVVIAIGVANYTDYNNQLPTMPLRLLQYIIAAISGLLMGFNVPKRKA